MFSVAQFLCFTPLIFGLVDARDVLARDRSSLVFVEGACIVVRVFSSKAWGLVHRVHARVCSRHAETRGKRSITGFDTFFKRRRLSESREHRRPGPVGGRFFLSNSIAEVGDGPVVDSSLSRYCLSILFPIKTLRTFGFHFQNRCAAALWIEDYLLADQRPDLQAFKHLLTLIHGL